MSIRGDVAQLLENGDLKVEVRDTNLAYSVD